MVIEWDVETTLSDEAKAVISELRAMKDSMDVEGAHNRADKLLVEFVRSLGHHEIADAFAAVPKWYA